MNQIREIPLVRFLTLAGVGSRRHCDRLIKEGHVQINDRPAGLGDRVNEANDRILVDGIPVQTAPEMLYILLNKPKGYLVSNSDNEGRPLAKDLLPDLGMRLFAVGRLDFQTEGALLFTNDGLWANKIAHPRNRIIKTYLAKVRKIPSPQVLQKWTDGIYDHKQFMRAESVSIEKTTGSNAWLKVMLSGGVNRQVRRMGLATGYPVSKLIRIAIGSIELKNLKPGEWRYLSPAEIRALQQPGQKPVREGRKFTSPRTDKKKFDYAAKYLGEKTGPSRRIKKSPQSHAAKSRKPDRPRNPKSRKGRHSYMMKRPFFK